LHRFEPFFVLTPTYWRQRQLIKKLHEFTDNVITTRREKLLKNPNLLSQYDEELGKKKKMALLDILLQSTVAEKPLSNLDIREEIDTFMFEVFKLKLFLLSHIRQQILHAKIFIVRVTTQQTVQLHSRYSILRNAPTFSKSA
jgi:hypothetical protein